MIRLLILLNYLLFMSMKILANFAIMTDNRTNGDKIYLIVSVVFLFVFGAPLVKQLLVYHFMKFIPLQKFSNIFV